MNARWLAALALVAACKSGDPISEDAPPVRPAKTTPTPVAKPAATAAAPARAGKHVDFDERVAWKTWDEAARIAKAENRAIMLVIYADWCPHCRTLAPVFANPDIQKLAEKLVMVHQNSDEDPPFLARYASFGTYVPRILFVTPDGAVKTELNSGNDKYPHFYTAEGIEALKTSMRRAAGG